MHRADAGKRSRQGHASASNTMRSKKPIPRRKAPRFADLSLGGQADLEGLTGSMRQHAEHASRTTEARTRQSKRRNTSKSPRWREGGAAHIRRCHQQRRHIRPNTRLSSAGPALTRPDGECKSKAASAAATRQHNFLLGGALAHANASLGQPQLAFIDDAAGSRPAAKRQ